MANNPLAIIEELEKSKGLEAANQVYDKWAQNYDEDIAKLNFNGYEKLMEHFKKLNVPKEAKILDVCAGTGLMGKELLRAGYLNAHAMDGSKEMLEQAKKEDIYRSYEQLLFLPDSRLPYADNSFDCAVQSGGFAPNHLPIVALREICRVVKKGGVIAFVCCDPDYYADKDEQFADRGFFKLVDKLRDEGLWKEREGYPTEISYIDYSKGYVFVFDVTG